MDQSFCYPARHYELVSEYCVDELEWSLAVAECLQWNWNYIVSIVTPSFLMIRRTSGECVNENKLPVSVTVQCVGCSTHRLVERFFKDCAE